MSAAKLAIAALLLAAHGLSSTEGNAQIFDTGEGTCMKCGHSELDTQRYVNSFLNQLFYYPDPIQQAAARTAIAASLYGLTATFEMHGNLSPDPVYSSVTIAITAEVKSALPTGSYKVTVTTPGGTSIAKVYALGNNKFDVDYPYAPGARRGGGGGGGGGPGGPRGPDQSDPGGGGGGAAKCTRTRYEERGHDMTVWCSRD
jgi:hypothetical protein